MPFLKKATIDYYMDNNQIKLTGAYFDTIKNKLKKITGSKVYALLGQDTFKSPFICWCEMMGLWKEKGDDFITKAGAIIEDTLLEYSIAQTSLYWESFAASERDYDEFDGTKEGFVKNEIFGGLLDGVPCDEITPILEIKTCAINKWSWQKDNTRGDGLFVCKDEHGYPIVKAKGLGKNKWYVNECLTIPKQYQCQLELYCWLKKQPKGLFCVAFLEDEDYLLPQQFLPTPKNTRFIPIKFDAAKTQQTIIEPLTKWYNQYVKTGISPTMTPQDKQWLIDKIGFVEWNKIIAQKDR